MKVEDLKKMLGYGEDNKEVLIADKSFKYGGGNEISGIYKYENEDKIILVLE